MLSVFIFISVTAIIAAHISVRDDEMIISILGNTKEAEDFKSTVPALGDADGTISVLGEDFEVGKANFDGVSKKAQNDDEKKTEIDEGDEEMNEKMTDEDTNLSLVDKEKEKEEKKPKVDEKEKPKKPPLKKESKKNRKKEKMPEDENPEICRYLQAKCSLPSVKKICKKTCACPELTNLLNLLAGQGSAQIHGGEQPICTDRRINCKDMVLLKGCGEPYAPYMKEYCPLSCGMCNR
ncbi:unnamed protein product [Dracunculus medinensis]|uniref:ShKT domain-containing protein n=1 Tax=Dracunculus medinensis TaxID=318479 RepID=A0A0N4UQ20_DRAME|nr:unnamed protein product [Dracunculus medinensis]